MRDNQKSDVKKLVTVQGRTEAEMILDILKQNGIAAYQKSNGAGELMEIYSAMSFSGYEIYCLEQDLPRAKELLDSVGLGDDRQNGQGMRTYRVTPAVRVLALILVVVIVGVIVISLF